MLNKKDTLILFGRSSFINEIRDEIPLIIEEFHTMGCNYFCETFPEVEYVIFYDDLPLKVNPKSTIVTNVVHLKDATKKSNKLCTTHKKAEFYQILKNKDEFNEKQGCLNFWLHTPSMAFNWAWQKGYKNVVIAGIDLIVNTPHFDKDTTPDADCPDFVDSTVANARKHIIEVVSRYLNVYQLNPKSDIPIPKITLKELIG